MTTLHKCDVCGEVYSDRDEITVIKLKQGEKFNMAQTYETREVCQACEPDHLLGELAGDLKQWEGGGSAE